MFRVKIKSLSGLNVIYYEGTWGTWPGEKPLGAKEKTNDKLNPHMTLTPGYERGPHW